MFEISRLTDFDFEAVCKDIFESHFHISLEIFTPGPDGGIDLRHLAEQQHGDLIIQCKHWMRSGRAALIQHMKKVELPKIEALNPSRYILATSVSLTPAAKNKLVDALNPYLRSPSDIYGLQEIESLLQSHPEIVRRHLRLWLSSAAVLQSLLNKKILTRSLDLAEDAQQAMLVYAPNQSYPRASEIIEDKHVCIISGIPGIGKTTLAQVLSVTYANSGYEVFQISEDADEINAVWDDTVAQFFYYDDFLGQTALDDKLHKNEDSRLLRILRRVNRSKNKRMILTTREYILEQARQRYERIGAEDFSPLTAILSLSDYTDVIRAEILYNHVYFSALADDDKALFAEPVTYMRIIRSPKFNPRLIDYSIRASVAHGDRGSAVTQEIFNNLVTPRRIWEHIVLHQLDSLSVDILVTLFVLQQRPPLDELTAAVKTYLAQTGGQFNDREFKKSLKILDSTMVKITSNPPETRIEYHNPSIVDYMRHHIYSSELVLINLLNSIASYDQLQRIWVLFKWRVAEAMLERPTIRQSIIDAALRMFGKEVIEESANETYPRYDTFRRGALVLDIAEKLDSDDMRKSVKAWYCSMNPHRDLPDIDSVVELAEVMFRSKSATIRKLVLDGLDGMIDFITEDISDWNNARAAKDALAKLERVASPGASEVISAAVESVEEHINDHARSAIEYTAETGILPYHPQDLDEMIAYAKQYRDAEEIFPGLPQAESLAATQQNDAPSVRISDRLEDYETRPESEKIISQMLGMLREPKQ